MEQEHAHVEGERVKIIGGMYRRYKTGTFKETYCKKMATQMVTKRETYCCQALLQCQYPKRELTMLCCHGLITRK